MMNNLKKIKLFLLDFFIKKEKYIFYKNKNNNIYLYSINNDKKFKIIKIVDNFNDNFENYFIYDNNVNNLKNFFNKKFINFNSNIFSIIFNNNINDNKIQKNENGDINLFINDFNYLNQINYYYPNIFFDFQKKIEKEKNIFPDDKNNQISENKNMNYNNSINELNNRFNNNNFIVTWILIIFLSIIPIANICFGFILFNVSLMKEDILINNNIFKQTIMLLYGGLTKDLVIWNNQWWRLWSWPIIDVSIFNLIMNIFLIYNLSKYNEFLIGKFKLILFLLFGIPIVGLVIMTIFPNNVFGESTVVLAILWGVTFVYNFNRKKIYSLFFNQKNFYIPIWLFIIPFFKEDFILYIVIFVSVFVGSAFGYLLEFNKLNKININIFYPIFIIFSFLLISFIFLNFKIYTPSINFSVINTLIIYENSGIVNENSYLNILNNYYFYPYSYWLQFWK